MEMETVQPLEEEMAASGGTLREFLQDSLPMETSFAAKWQLMQ